MVSTRPQKIGVLKRRIEWLETLVADGNSNGYILAELGALRWAVGELEKLLGEIEVPVEERDFLRQARIPGGVVQVWTDTGRAVVRLNGRATEIAPGDGVY